MLPEAQLLTILTSFANYIPGGPSPLVESATTSVSFHNQAGHNYAGDQERANMAHETQHRRHRSSASTENELWFSMSRSARRQQEFNRAPEQSAYRATSANSLTVVPSIATTIDTNKPLPPSPTESERKRRRPTYLRSLLGRSSSSQYDPTHLQPQPYQPHQSSHRYSATSTNLSLDTHNSYHHAYSRSMPSSPYDFDQTEASLRPAEPRASSAAANYPDWSEYQQYEPSSPQQSDTTYFVRPPRSSSLNTQFDITPPRARTFPDENSLASPAMRGGISNRPRPHTWLSPTESFCDPSQFSLFVQATTGLPEDADTLSPTGPPQLQGSLFARRSRNDIIPLPFQNDQPSSPREIRTDWQNFEPPPIPHQAASQQAISTMRSESSQSFRETPQMAAVNRELEMLGIEDDDMLDDELPDYAQSQAEAHERRRAEASARARELEARWRITRGN